MISSGGIINSPRTVHDVGRAHAIRVPDVASLKGETTMRKTPSFQVEYIPYPTQSVEVLHTDIMFEISVATPLDVTMSSI